VIKECKYFGSLGFPVIDHEYKLTIKNGILFACPVNLINMIDRIRVFIDTWWAKTGGTQS